MTFPEHMFQNMETRMIGSKRERGEIFVLWMGGGVKKSHIGGGREGDHERQKQS